MDCKRAEIHEVTPEEKKEWEEKKHRLLVQLSEKQVAKLKSKSSKGRKRYMKHQPCPCGSGKKFLKCCWHLYT